MDVQSQARFAIQADLCGICEQPGPTTPWRSSVSDNAHPACIQKIKQIDDNLKEQIAKHFPNPHNAMYRASAHGEALKEIKKQLGNVSILNYLETQGPIELEALFTSEKVKKRLEDFKQFTMPTYRSNHR